MHTRGEERARAHTHTHTHTHTHKYLPVLKVVVGLRPIDIGPAGRILAVLIRKVELAHVTLLCVCVCSCLCVCVHVCLRHARTCNAFSR